MCICVSFFVFVCVCVCVCVCAERENEDGGAQPSPGEAARMKGQTERAVENIAAGVHAATEAVWGRACSIAHMCVCTHLYLLVRVSPCLSAFCCFAGLAVWASAYCGPYACMHT